MRDLIAKTILLLITATPLAAAAEDAPSTPPSYWDLESPYPHGIRLNKAQHARQMELARARLIASVPIGTPFKVAEDRLQAGGATCRTDRHATGIVKCLYHQYDLSDGAADDIRWTVQLEVDALGVTDVSVDRYVDRHGTS